MRRLIIASSGYRLDPAAKDVQLRYDEAAGGIPVVNCARRGSQTIGQ
ncbi:hypothetical protein MCHIJ_14290 [Mycolicibacterium chitae]|nr:hypothetical protein [Mycolicibacterium chitae]MCV7105154.1 hypothetical protein [Mycolicibacterium chitae]BBZ01992.1 hypothetical protein MCHIJ_14290 [Mycolicibacterium chitae]